MSNILRYAIAWIGLVIIAILNGTLRVVFYLPYMSELRAHQLSTFTGIIFFGIYVWIISGMYTLVSARQAISIGLLWLLMTIIFEFIFGHFVMGNSWGKLFADYNILQGRVWLLVLLWTAVSPYVFYRIRK